MTYAFELGETIPNGTKRISLELIDSILLQLKDETNNRDEAIHEARKHFKQLRALLRLLRAEIGEDFYQAENAFYRDLALQLAPLRDAFVLIEAMDTALKGIEDSEVLETAKALRKDLKKEYKTIRRRLLKKNGAVSQVIATLETHRQMLEAWKIGNKFRVLEAGLERNYHAAQKRLSIAYKEKSAESYHEWRKAVKSLWYHCRLLEPSNPEMLSPYISELKNLSEFLGDANDIAILEDYLALHEKGQVLIAVIQEKRKALLADAKPLGKRLFKDERQKFTKKMKASWKKWQAIAA